MRTLKEIRSFYSSILELKKDDNSVQTSSLQIKSADEKRFADKHVIKKIADRNGNGDDVFNATNIKGVERSPKHGYNPGEDEKVYEEVDLDEAKRVIPAGPGFDPERADLDALSKEYDLTIKQHPSGGVHVTGSKENVNRFHKDTTKYNKITKMEEESTQIDEGDVIQFPKRNKKNDEEEKQIKKNKLMPGWMWDHPDAKPLLKKLQQIQARKERERKFREDEAKQFEESTQIDELDDAAGGYPINKKPNTTPPPKEPKPEVRTAVDKGGKKTTHVIMPGEKVVEAMDPDKKAKQAAIDTILKNHEEPAGEKGMPFEGPYTKVPEKQVGQKSDPSMSRAHHLARQAIVAKEDLEINEVLKPSMGVKAYINDFVKSDDPRFKGASKKDRIKRALAAYYSAKRGD